MCVCVCSPKDLVWHRRDETIRNERTKLGASARTADLVEEMGQAVLSTQLQIQWSDLAPPGRVAINCSS